MRNSISWNVRMLESWKNEHGTMNSEQHKYATFRFVIILLTVHCSIFTVHCDVSRIFDHLTTLILLLTDILLTCYIISSES